MTTPTTSATQQRANTAREQRVYWLGLIVGLVLVLIGVRFFLAPEGASFTFGVAHPPKGDELHYVIGIRDIWLGAMAMAFAWMGEWRALALWFVGAAACCLTDAVIVNQSTANIYALAFHLGSGVLCLVLARGAWILGNTQKLTP